MNLAFPLPDSLQFQSDASFIGGRWRPLILPGRWSWCDLDLFISILSLNFLDMRYEHLRMLFLRSCFPKALSVLI